jgi:hypothetical protein
LITVDLQSARETLTVLLDEPGTRNVPDSVRKDGHTVVSITPESHADSGTPLPAAAFLRKRGAPVVLPRLSAGPRQCHREKQLVYIPAVVP